jgi:hypothetical protein
MPIFMKLGTNIMPQEGISTVYVINPPISNANTAASQILGNNLNVTWILEKNLH